MGRIISLVLALLVLGQALCDDESPVVTVAQGNVKGQKVTPDNLAPYYSFLGIPYAKPPVGDLRFKAPVPIEPWNGTLEALREGNICTQQSATGIAGDEDCLFLNVFTPELPGSGSGPLRPVMVWIHGGGFTSGSGNQELQGPQYLLNTGIVYVSLNYRLGVLGFFSTQDAVAPGNAGMKDQVLALRWVKQNIAAFGGDPDKVTIFGESAGAGAVDFLLLSPMAKGLFRGVIADSGSAATPCFLADKLRENVFLLGKALGYTGESSQELVTFLRNVSADKLIATSAKIINPEDAYRISGMNMKPILEPVVEGEEPFLTDHPLTILEKGTFNNVSFITGINAYEGILNLGIMFGKGMNFQSVDENFAKVFKPELRYCRNDICGDEMVAKIKSFYFGDQPISLNNMQNFTDMCTDFIFAEGTVYMLKMISARSSLPVYLYHFVYDGALAYTHTFPSNITSPGHADELGYIFEFGRKVPDDSEAAKVRSRMVSMWANFVKTGNPTPDVSEEIPAWLPYTSDAKNFVEIGAQLKAKTDLHKERMDFWDNLYSSKK